MPKKKNKPKTGEKAESGLSSFLKTLSKGEPSEKLPSLPEPMFDKYLGGKFKRRKKKDTGFKKAQESAKTGPN